MRKIHYAAALAAVAVTMLGTTVTANAAPAGQTGYLNAEAHQGYMCGWSGDAPDWSVDPEAGANCLNNVIWVANNGYIENVDCVEMFWGTQYYGAGAFLPQGEAWDLTSNRYTFNYEGQQQLPGYKASLLNNVGSSLWTIAANCNQFGQ